MGREDERTMNTATGSMAPGAPSRAARLNIALCFAVAVLEGFDIQAIGVAAPRLAAELGLAPERMAWVFFASNLALVGGASYGGWLADRIGRKPVFMAAVAAFGAFTLATAFAHDFWTLMAMRVGAGLGFGAALPNMMAVAADISRPDRRASTATAMFCGLPAGGGCVALLTQVLPPDSDWRLLFVIGGVAPVLLLPALFFFMTETGARRAGEKAPSVGVWRALFGDGRAPATLLVWTVFLPTTLILYLILYWLPTLVTAKGLDRAVAPQASLWFNFASVAGALILGRVTDRFGMRWPLTLAYVGLVAVLLLLAGASDLPVVLALSGAAGFCVLGANYAFNGVAASMYPPEMRGTGSGAAVAVGRVGSVIGPLLPGLMLSSGAGPNEIINLMAPAAFIAGAAVLALSFLPRGPTT
ncbi:MAG: MFS transporter [Hyphomonadaceae bacterium]|nr:MFS transporter [Hyphomonadaceae bacterium]